MATRDDLMNWVYTAVKENRGRASVVTVARHIWQNHERELRDSGDLFYTWQYAMRWAAQKLRYQGRLTLADRDWALKQ